jgi:nitrogen fixation NifU-like protein
MSVLDALYQEAILQHYKQPRNFGALEPYDVKEEGVNPSCGDEVTLYLRLSDGTIGQISFEGDGCAISQASASLMTQAVKGLSVQRALAVSEKFRQMLRGGQPDAELGDLALLSGVAKLPARVRCAVLPFATLESALARTPQE